MRKWKPSRTNIGTGCCIRSRPEKARALLRSPCPLSDVYKEFRDRETEHMDTIRDSIETEADKSLQRQEKKQHRESRWFYAIYPTGGGGTGTANRPVDLSAKLWAAGACGMLISFDVCCGTDLWDCTMLKGNRFWLIGCLFLSFPISFLWYKTLESILMTNHITDLLNLKDSDIQIKSISTHSNIKEITLFVSVAGAAVILDAGISLPIVSPFLKNESEAPIWRISWLYNPSKMPA